LELDRELSLGKVAFVLVGRCPSVQNETGVLVISVNPVIITAIVCICTGPSVTEGIECKLPKIQP